MYGFLYMNNGVRLFHSSDLEDMRDALLSDDDDGPDGGVAIAHPKTAQRSDSNLPVAVGYV